MTNKMKYVARAGLAGLVLSLTACGTTGGTATTGTSATAPARGPAPATLGSTAIEAALPLVRTGAAVAAGAVLDFAVKQSSSRTRLANEMYAAANAVYSLSGGTFPAPAQFESSILAFGGSQADANYAQFSTAIAGLYAAYYPKLATGDTKTAGDLLNAIAGGIEDATQAYVTAPAVASVAELDGINGMGGTELTEGKAGLNFQIFQMNQIGEKGEGNGVARSPADGSSAFPSAPWERGELTTVSF